MRDKGKLIQSLTHFFSTANLQETLYLLFEE